jgi:hypothetical protein
MKNTILSEVKIWVAERTEDEYTEKQILEDLQYGGCISGMVSGLIYYYDTCRFYNKHRQSIFALVEEFCDSCGESLKEFLQHANNFPLTKEELEHESFVSGISGLIRKNKDLADQIKNWFAWFGFEQTAYEYYSEKYDN